MIEENKEKIDLTTYSYDPPKLYKIVDKADSTTDTGEYLVGNEGHPERYLNNWLNGDLKDGEKLSKDADIQLGYSGTAKT